MTQSHPAEKAAERCAGELLWNISLLPVSSQPAPAPPALVIELPLNLTIQEAARRRNAA